MLLGFEAQKTAAEGEGDCVCHGIFANDQRVSLLSLLSLPHPI